MHVYIIPIDQWAMDGRIPDWESFRAHLNAGTPEKADEVLAIAYGPGREDSVERDDADDRWLGAILDGTDDYLAVTERGAYVTLVSRSAAINAVLRSLVPAAPMPARSLGMRTAW